MRLPKVSKGNPGAIGLGTSMGLWALIVGIFWSPCLLGPMTPLLGDAQAHMLPWRAERTPPPHPRWDALLWDGMAQYYPWRVFAARSAQRGLIPLWNPYQFCGTPFVANGQSAFFYPPNMLLWLVDSRYAFGLSAALHYFIAGSLMLLLSRELGLRPAAGLVGAAAYSMGGFMVSWTALPTLMNTAAWLPGAVWAVERAFRRRRHLDFLVVAMMLSMSLLAGHLQIAAYVWLVAALHLVGRTVWAGRKRNLGGIIRVFTAPVLAVLVAAGQLLPTLELAKHSPRGNAPPTDEGFEFRRQRSLRPYMLKTLLLPDALGTPEDWAKAGLSYTETCGYVGRSTLVLAMCALLGLRSRKALCLAGLGAIALVGAMGGPVARLLYFHVPGLGQAGGFGRMLCVYTFAVAVLAGMGTEWLAVRLAQAKSAPSLPKVGHALPVFSVLMVCVELSSWARSVLPLSPRTRVYPATKLTNLLADLSRHGDRILAITRRADWTIHKLPNALLPPNTATAYGYNDAQGYDSLYPISFARYAASVAPEGHTPITNGNMVLIDDLSGPVYGWVDIRWVVAPTSVSLPSSQFVRRWRVGGVTVLENMNARPRLAVVGTSSMLPLQDMATMDPCQISVELPAGRGNRVTIAETVYPGWRAYADGRPCALHASPSLGWEVSVPTETKRLDLVYQPASFAVGAFASLVGLAAIAYWLFESIGRKHLPPKR